ncbi:MAG: hypothetical protein ACR2JV_09195 [Gaiellales bacterium]
MRRVVAVLGLALAGLLAIAVLAVATERGSVRELRAASRHEPVVGARVRGDRTRSDGLRVIDATYRSPYGRPMDIKVYAPARHRGALPFVWRFAPSFWQQAPRCQPFTRGQPARWGFVYACVGVDDRTGWAGDHAFGDPRALREALRLRATVEQLVRARASEELVIGSSASSVDALDAVGIEPRRFSAAIIFDSPANLAARYWDLSSVPRAHTTPEYGGPPTGPRRRSYIDRSPIARVRTLATSPTEFRFYLSRTDAVACDPQQMPRFLHLLARDRHRAVPVMVGAWQHGTGWTYYAGYEMQRLGIAPPTVPVAPPEVHRVTASPTSRVGCSSALR